jgi:hypothetical protein
MWVIFTRLRAACVRICGDKPQTVTISKGSLFFPPVPIVGIGAEEQRRLTWLSSGTIIGAQSAITRGKMCWIASVMTIVRVVERGKFTLRWK